ncbi:MAG: response regulator transcription factor [Chloroflexota bacterium]
MQQKKLLLIDDEPAIQTLVRLVMEADGWQVLVASEGARGLDLAREQKPDVILLDVALPDVSGLEICRQLKADPATNSVPIAMLTAMAQETDRRAAMALGADDYVTKPWRPAALIARVSSLLEKRSKKADDASMENR